jgi:hypothetical protein
MKLDCQAWQAMTDETIRLGQKSSARRPNPAKISDLLHLSEKLA